ncbi:MAG: extracellular solute-binding protein [Lachnospiraceae bacterium]|nr:extracellular solute-binding protein [Lachnospiraceae bacterium]
MSISKRMVSVVLCICLVACAVLFGKAPEAEELPEEIVGDSVVVWYADENMTDYISAMAVAFHEEYDIRVIPQLQSGLEYVESIYDASVTDETATPDVYIISNEALEKAYLTGLADVISDPDSVVNTEHFPQTAINAVTYENKLVGYPYYFETSVLLYNRSYIYEMAKNQLLAETTDESAAGGGEVTVSDETSTEETSTAEEVTEEDIEARIVELIPQTFEELLAFANEYDAPAAVDGVFKWDVSDIFYNYFFAGNYMNVGGPCSDTPEEVDIYNLDAIKAMQIYQSLNQFFSFEANDMKYASVIEEFMAGKMVYTTATSDIIKTLDAAKEEGTFAFDYGLMEIPDLNEELQTKNLSVTNTVVVNGFSDGKEDANKFASYLTSKAAESLYEKTGKIPALTKEACKDERTAVFYREYENSVPAPKMMVTSNLWVQLEVTFTEVWNGAGVSRSLQNLSEMIMSQINGADYEEEFIEEPKEEEETVEYLDEEAEREAALQEEE